MNVALWVVTALLALVYLAAGGTKLVKERERLADNPNFGYVNDFSDGAIKAIGGAEVLGAVGLIVPWLIGIAPVLTPIAAVGLAVLQVGALVVHGRRREFKSWPANLVLLALAVFVAVGRFGS